MGKEKKNKKEKSKKSKKDQKDKKRRRADSESDDSDSSDDDRRKRAKAERLADKLARHLEKRSQPVSQHASSLQFNDPEPGKKFVWKKKIEKDLTQGRSIKEYSMRAERERQNEREQEIEKVRKRREEREAERVRMEEELSIVQRERALVEAVELEAQEEQFHLQQAQVRAARRIRMGRAKPVDLIVRNLFLMEGYDASQEPYSVFEGLLLEDVQDLVDDIKFYKDLDRHNPDHKDFWEALTAVADHELAEAQKRDEADRAHLKGMALPAAYEQKEAGLHPSVEREIEAMLAGQKYVELEEWEKNINRDIEAGKGDPDYWEAVLKRLVIHKAKARLREIQASMIKAHLDKLFDAQNIREAMGWDREAEEEEAKRSGAMVSDQDKSGPGESESEPERERAQAGPGGSGPSADELQGDASPTREQELDVDADEDEDEDGLDLMDGRFSPPPVDPASVAGLDIVNEEDDVASLELLRKQVRLEEASKFQAAAEIAARSSKNVAADLAYQSMVRDPGLNSGAVHPMMRNITDAAPQGDEIAFRSGRAPLAADDAETQGLRAQAMRVMGADEGDAPFRGEVQLDSQVYWWHDKYRPRKPKYFNRVHTGYEWNKYNQTHYDHDNPPPKVVQGYKFNIFYPDLIDKSVTPTYKVEPDPSCTDGSTAVLRFKAGPPYEDIAFRIVNKEWEYSHKKGFKSTFERGILHLYFNFKRTRYRR